MNGSLNGSSSSAVSALGTSVLSSSIAAGAGKGASSAAAARKYGQEQSKAQLLDARADKIKDKVGTLKETEESDKKLDTISVLHTGAFLRVRSERRMLWVLLIY